MKAPSLTPPPKAPAYAPPPKAPAPEPPVKPPAPAPPVNPPAPAPLPPVTSKKGKYIFSTYTECVLTFIQNIFIN